MSDFLNRMKSAATADLKTIVLPEGEDPRTIVAATKIIEEGLAKIVILGNPDEFTMLELAEHIIRLTGSRSEIVFRPLPSDDPKQRQPDITLARKLLHGWTPSISLVEGLRKTISYFQGL